MTPERFDIVDADFLSPPHRVCPICRASSPRRETVTLQSDPDVFLAECPVCHGASATRFPTESFLRALYDPERYESDLLVQPSVTARFGRHLARRVTAAPTAALSFVDYGGNDGGLSIALRDALRARGHVGPLSFDVVDLVTRPPRGEVRFSTVEEFVERGAQYDVVLASAVLEHLVDLPIVVERLLRACRPGAVFYARAPWERDLHRLVPGYGIRWPRHLHDLGPRFWGRFLETFGHRGELLHSAPSPVESGLSTKPVRTIAATILKAPSRLEVALRGRGVGERGPIWKLVGGWEAWYRIDGRRESH